MVTTPLIFKYPLLFSKAVKKNLEMIIDRWGMNRVQAAVKAADPRAVRFLEWLGFAKEGYMVHYGPDGSDHFLMGRV